MSIGFLSRRLFACLGLAGFLGVAAAGIVVADDGAPATGGDRAARLTVFADASLMDGLKAAVDAYHAKTGMAATLTVAADASLARQIEAGAAVDVFVAAGNETVDRLVAGGFAAADSITRIAGNRLAIVGPAGADPLGLTPPALLDRLGDGLIAVGDPEDEPVGRFARAAFVSLGIWEAIEGRLDTTENVRLVLDKVAAGERPLGVVFMTDAIGDGRVALVAKLPGDSHPAIVYRGVATRAGDRARADGFLAFLAGEEGQAILAEAGFRAP